MATAAALVELQTLRDATLSGRELLARSIETDGNVHHHQMLEAESALYAAMRAAHGASGSLHIGPYGPRQTGSLISIRRRRQELKAKPVAVVSEIEDLGAQARLLFGELRQRSMCLDVDVARGDHGVGYALNVPESLSLAQLRAISASADARHDSDRLAVRTELNKRLHPRDELEFLVSIKDGPLYDEAYVTRMIDDAQCKLVDMLGRPAPSLRQAWPTAIDVDELPALLEVAERFARKFVPDGFVGYDVAQAAYELAIAEGREAEASDEAWDLYDPRCVDFVTLKKAIAAAHERVAKASVEYDEGEGEAARRVEREAAGLPADLPWERPAEHECPLTCERMLDPVLAADGMTYERTAIMEWFFKGHLTSPMTRRDLASDELTPNRALKTLIRDWLKEEHQKVMTVTWMALAAAAAEGRKRGRDEC